MPMPMMQIGIMRVLVAQRAVLVRMGMRPGVVMSVLVMRVMYMPVIVVQQVMIMVMGVLFGQVQPQPRAHKSCGQRQLPAHCIAQGNRQHRPDKRGQREIGAGPGGPQMPKGRHEQRKAETVAQKTHQPTAQNDALCRQALPDSQGDPQINRPRDKPFDHGDLQRVRAG